MSLPITHLLIAYLCFHLLGFHLYPIVIISSAQIAWEGAKADGHHNAHHSLCTWHKIHMGLLSLRLGSFPIPETAKEIMADVKKWLNWFCTRSSILLPYPYTVFTTSLALLDAIILSYARCETLKHGLEARRHLQEHVASPYFCRVCGEGSSRALLKWLANSFFNVQHKLLFYYRLDVRCFDEYVNSAVEGQHSSVKTTNTGKHKQSISFLFS